MHPSPTIFLIPPPPITPHFLPISPHSPPPFPPIFPHFPPFFLVLGTLRVHCWVYYHQPRLGIFEAYVGNYGELWGIMVKLWGIMGNYGEL